MNNEVKVIVFNKHSVGHLARVPRFPLPGETIKAKVWEFGQDAAKGTNAAVVLGRLGVPTAFIEKVGNDSGGEFGLKWLKEAGVDTSRFILSDDIVTDQGVVIIRDDGENMIIGSAPHECYIKPSDIEDGIAAFPGAEYFVSGLEINHDMALYACKYAKECGKITILNASPLAKPIDDDLSYVDYLFVNEVEAAQLAGIPAGDDIGDVAKLPEKMSAHYKPQKIVMTIGGEGCIVYDTKTGVQNLYPGYKVQAIDTVGAGDGFMAAFTAALTWGYSEKDACDFANKYGALVVQLYGSILIYPTLKEAEEGFKNL
ncbi:MAG: ribokinase [Firmicutes bacterium]|nr:ribokinase [Bacillota bacterium]